MITFVLIVGTITAFGCTCAVVYQSRQNKPGTTATLCVLLGLVWLLNYHLATGAPLPWM